jgi:hypothetical protein
LLQKQRNIMIWSRIRRFMGEGCDPAGIFPLPPRQKGEERSGKTD